MQAPQSSPDESLPEIHAETRSDKLHSLIATALNSEAGFSTARAELLAAHFATLEEFLSVKPRKLQILSVTGKKITSLTEQQVVAIQKLQKSRILRPDRAIKENFLILITRNFVRTQIEMLNSLSLDRLSPNPFLIKCLHLKTAREIVEVNVFMFATRSIVTSMGFFVEKLLLASSQSASRCEKPWDLVKTDSKNRKHWIQVKSGPNDMDADQIRHWAKNMAAKIDEGDEAYIGITYGKRSRPTVTTGLFKTYLPDWEKRTLIGRELWDFISEDPTYHEKLFPLLAEAAAQILGSDSIGTRIQTCVRRITKEFVDRYQPQEEAVQKYLADIF